MAKWQMTDLQEAADGVAAAFAKNCKRPAREFRTITDPALTRQFHVKIDVSKRPKMVMTGDDISAIGAKLAQAVGELTAVSGLLVPAGIRAAIGASGNVRIRAIEYYQRAWDGDQLFWRFDIRAVA